MDRADYNVGNLESEIKVQFDQAVSALNQTTTALNEVTSGLKDVISQLDSLKGNTGLKNVAQQADDLKRSTTGEWTQKAFNFGDVTKSAIKIGALFSTVRKGLGFVKEATQANIDMIETTNLFEVQMGKVVDQYGNLDEAQSQYYTRAMAFQDEMNEKLATNKSEMQKYQAMYFGMLNAQLGAENRDASYMMSESLTKAGYDIASLYNLDVETAMNKLKSGLAGQIESLRQIGIDVSEASLSRILDQVGIERSVQQLSYAEKEVARYIAICQQAGQAQGDFARTFEQPANQIRVFKNQLIELKQVAGSFFTGLLGQILPVVNGIIMAIKEVLKAIASFFGIKLNSGGSNITSSLGGVADTVGDVGSGLGKATKQAKEFKKQLMGFDEINNIEPPTQSAGGGGSGGGAVGGIDPALLDALREWDNKMSSINGKAQQIRDKILSIGKKIKELVPYFKSGFKISFGNTNFDGIKKSIENIKKSWAKIWDSPEVKTSLNNYAKTIAFTFGQIVGSLGRIGINIADGLIGGIEKYLGQNTNRVKDHITSMFNIKSEILTLVGNFVQALGEISDVFAGDTAKQIGSDIIAMFANPLMSVKELLLKFAKDELAILIQPITDNVNKIKVALENTFKPAETILRTFADAFTFVGDKLNEVYDQHIKPLLESIKIGLSDTFGKLLDTYNEYIAPVLQTMADKFSELWNEHLKPLVDKIGEFVGSVADALTALWENILKPLIDWIVENIVPVLTPIFESIWNTLCTVCGYIADAIGGVIDVFKGIVDFLVGIFTGDWDKAWKGIKSIFNGIWETIKGIVQSVWSAICGIVETAINIVKGIVEAVFNGIKDFISTIWNTIKTVISTVWEGITTVISNAIKGIKNTITNILNTIESIWTNIWNGISTFARNIWNAITNTISNVINNIKNVITNTLNAIKTMWSNVWNSISGIVSQIVNNIINFFGQLPQNMLNIGKNLVQGLWNGINNAKNWVLDKIKGFGSSILNGIKGIFGIHSPSTVFRDEVGKNLVLGLVSGIDNNSYQAVQSVKDMATEVTEAVSDNMNVRISPELNQGIKINTRDFAVDTNQYVNYSAIKGQIQAQSQVNMNENIANKVAEASYNAFVKAMRDEGVNIEVKADEGIIFKKVQKSAREYTMQTGEPAFGY